MIPFFQLKNQFASMEHEIRDAVERVLTSGWYILGEELKAFEREFAEYVGAAHCLGVASGTDAIHLALRAAGVGPGDEVITVANTCVPTLCGITASGATPRLVDVDPETLTLDPNRLEAAITPRTRAVVPVHLYGHPCDMDPIVDIAAAHGLVVVEDCAQAHGSLYKGKKCGTFGAAAAFSFYPTKNLGAYGDGGAVVTSDPAIADSLRLIRNYGEKRRYEHTVEGVNSRLDEVQAAVLRVKLPRLDTWNRERRIRAAWYEDILSTAKLTLPAEASWATGNRHLFPIRVKDRDELQDFLASRSVYSLIHYPVPIHLQEAYRSLGKGQGDFPVSEEASRAVLSLPLYPELAKDDLLLVAGLVSEFAR
ncbi:MAG: aminotransferase [Candidatus Hydrogenedentota bacterium]